MPGSPESSTQRGRPPRTSCQVSRNQFNSVCRPTSGVSPPRRDGLPAGDQPGFAQQAIQPQRTGQALQRLDPEVLTLHQWRHQPVRVGGQHGAVARRQPLDPRGDVRCFAGGHRRLQAVRHEVLDHHRARVQPQPHAHLQAQFRLKGPIQRRQPLQDVQCRPRRPARAVFMGLRVAEEDQHPIAQVLGQVPAKALGRLRARRLVGPDQPPQHFRIQALGQRGGLHQICKQHRQLPPLGLACRTLRGDRRSGRGGRGRRRGRVGRARVQRLAAPTTKARPQRIREPAGGARPRQTRAARHAESRVGGGFFFALGTTQHGKAGPPGVPGSRTDTAQTLTSPARRGKRILNVSISIVHF